MEKNSQFLNNIVGKVNNKINQVLFRRSSPTKVSYKVKLPIVSLKS